jgi:type IV pilus assembly protein PilW
MYRTQTGAMAAARYNKPGGLGPNYSLNAQMFAFGRAPTVARYYIQNENLVVDPVLQGVTGLPVAAGVVQLQAQYGRDTNNDGAVDVWDETTPAAANDWAGVVAVRLGLVARSAQAERPDASGACTTTTAFPTWAAGPFDLSARADWSCFRYRVFEATVSLRNMIWRPT